MKLRNFYSINTRLLLALGLLLVSTAESTIIGFFFFLHLHASFNSGKYSAI